MNFRTSCAAVAALTVLAGPAAAADLGGNCCADLEERIAELEATTVRKGNRKVKLELSGHVNEAVLFWDDGDDSNTVSPSFQSEDSNIYQGTNDVARTRFRLKGDAKIADDWKAGFLIEFGVRANRLTRTDEQTDEGGTAIDLRHSAWWIENKHAGRVWLGNTSQATDGITEINTANMNHFARISASKWNLSNRIIVDGFRSADRRWRDLLPTDGLTGDNVPGEGDRWNLVKWVSPKLHGFELSAAWGEDDFWDVALRYAGEHAGFKIAAGIGYQQWTDDNFFPEDGVDASSRGCASTDPDPATASDPGASGNSDNECSALGLSASVMHESTGLFVTAAYGIKTDDLRDDIFRNANLNGVGISPIDNEDWFWGIQAGIEKKFVELGKTTLYGEFGHFEAGAQIGDESGAIRTFNSAFPNLGAGFNFSRGSQVEYWGLGVNQHISNAAMDLYLGYRHYEGEITLGDSIDGGSTKFDIEAMDQVMTGAMIKF